MFELIYITNDSDRARVAEVSGVDQIMVDLEIHGKENRQRGMNTVISRHSPSDVSVLREILRKSTLMVRINPLFEGSKVEIDDAIARGADRIMLPMFTTVDEVRRFRDLVAGKAATTLLLETPGALARLPEVLDVSDIDCVHVGLNDLHLAFGLGFMFELLSGGIVSYAADQVRARGVAFGFGGVARLAEGRLPARLILSEHVRLGSRQVILSRDFGRVFDNAQNYEEALVGFRTEVRRLRRQVAIFADASKQELEENRRRLVESVRSICAVAL